MPFCAGGTILESHTSLDPKMKSYLIDRKITCPDGTLDRAREPATR